MFLFFLQYRCVTHAKDTAEGKLSQGSCHCSPFSAGLHQLCWSARDTPANVTPLAPHWMLKETDSEHRSPVLHHVSMDTQSSRKRLPIQCLSQPHFSLFIAWECLTRFVYFTPALCVHRLSVTHPGTNSGTPTFTIPSG